MWNAMITVDEKDGEWWQAGRVKQVDLRAASASTNNRHGPSTSINVQKLTYLSHYISEQTKLAQIWTADLRLHPDFFNLNEWCVLFHISNHLC